MRWAMEGRVKEGTGGRNGRTSEGGKWRKEMIGARGGRVKEGSGGRKGLEHGEEE